VQQPGAGDRAEHLIQRNRLQEKLIGKINASTRASRKRIRDVQHNYRVHRPGHERASDCLDHRPRRVHSGGGGLYLSRHPGSRLVLIKVTDMRGLVFTPAR
jgi:hypothetical protein